MKIDNFDNMGLRQELLRGIYSYGFERPSTIQQKAIVPTIKYARPDFTRAHSPAPSPIFLSCPACPFVPSIYPQNHLFHLDFFFILSSLPFTLHPASSLSRPRSSSPSFP